MSFECLEVAHETALAIRNLLVPIERRDRSMADQILRAMGSLVSNLDEGSAFDGPRRTNHYRIALGSAREVTSHLRLALTWRYVDDIDNAMSLLDRIRAMLWRLTH